MRLFRIAVATWFGTGLVPLAPGTVGTLGAVPLVLVLWILAPGWPHLAATGTLTLVGTWAGWDALATWGREDPGLVVVDEVAGFLLATAFLPPSLPLLVAAFVLFRVADILKPWPCRMLEALPRGWGIMMDDLAAGLYANLVLQAALLIQEALA